MRTQKQQSSCLLLETLAGFWNETSLTHDTSTVEGYDYDVKKFIEFLQFRNIKTTGKIQSIHITDYLASCKKNGKVEASVRRYYMSIRCYCRFLYRNGLVSKDLTYDIKAPKLKLVMPKIPTKQDIEMLLSMPDTTTNDGLRDKAILELLYSSGLRASELIDLQIDDVQDTQIRVSCGKGGKTRVIPLTDEAKDWINEYIQQVRGIADGYLFVTSIRPKMNRALLARVVKLYAKRAKLPYVTPHTLRHSCATHLLEQGADLRLIQEVLGHASMSSTQRYTQLSSVKMDEMFHKFHPRKAKQCV